MINFLPVVVAVVAGIVVVAQGCTFVTVVAKMRQNVDGQATALNGFDNSYHIETN